jgi:hypothetical protein
VYLSGIANTGQSFDPGAFGYPAVAPSFANSCNNATIADVGLVSDIDTASNYGVSRDGTTGDLLCALHLPEVRAEARSPAGERVRA